MHLGDKLKLYRKRKDLDQRQMAGLLDVGYRTYQEIERTGIVTKSATKEQISKLLEGNTQVSASKEEASTDGWYRAKIDDLIRTNEKHADNYGRLSEAYLVLAGKINSGMSGEVSEPLMKKDKSSKRRGIADLPDTRGTHLKGSQHQQKGNVAG